MSEDLAWFLENTKNRLVRGLKPQFFHPSLFHTHLDFMGTLKAFSNSCVQLLRVLCSKKKKKQEDDEEEARSLPAISVSMIRPPMEFTPHTEFITIDQ